MNLELTGRKALVTGASKGIGRVIARTLAREGAELILCASKVESLTEIKSEFEKKGTKFWLGGFDANDPKRVEDFFSSTVTKIGRLDILVNNVGGVVDHAKFEELTERQWLDSWNLNFMTMVRFTKNSLPFLRLSKHARIINISSSAGKQPGAFNPHYGAAKAAVNSLSKYLANQLSSEKILVNSIIPATVSDGLWFVHIADKAKRLGVTMEEATRIMEEEIASKIPLGRVGKAEDVAELVAFLASDRAEFITGTCIAVDGGLVKSIF